MQCINYPAKEIWQNIYFEYVKAFLFYQICLQK